MIQVVGVEGTREHEAAQTLRELIVRAWPEVETSQAHDVRLVAGAKCHGQATRDIDILLLASFGAGMQYSPFLSFEGHDGRIQLPPTVHVRSLCIVIEVKDHRPEDVRFVGTAAEVRYQNRWHSATEQNERQMYAVKGYLEHQGMKPPWIAQLVWLRNVPNTILPPRPHPIIGAQVTWELILNVIGQTRPPRWKDGNWVIEAAGDVQTPLPRVADLFTKIIAPTRLDRQRMERIAQHGTDLQPFRSLIGDKLVILRGRGGTGKTVRLLQLARLLVDDEGARVLILTYNKALVADIRRLLTILGIRDDITGGAIHIQTVHSFLYSALKGLGIIGQEVPEFLDQYEQLKNEALEYLRGGAVGPLDVELALQADVEAFRWDYVFVDEGQDWPRNEIDLLLALYPSPKIVVADGVDQLVRGPTRADWRSGLKPSASRVVPIKRCLRMKAGLARFVTAVAHELGLLFDDWEPNPDIPGGRVLIIDGPYLRDHSLHDSLIQDNIACGNAPIDMLFCVSPGSIPTVSGAERSQSAAALVFEQWGYKTWDGASQSVRESYPTDLDQLRIVQYESCRGLEGWTVINLSLDRFYDIKLATYAQSNIPGTDNEPGVFERDDSAAKLFAAQWLLLPLTRAIDSLVIQLDSSSSRVAQALRAVADEHADYVEWRTAR